MDEAVEKGDFALAQKLQHAANEVIYKMCSAEGNMYAVAKAVIGKKTGLSLGGVREPLMNLCKGDEKVIDEAYELVIKATKLITI